MKKVVFSICILFFLTQFSGCIIPSFLAGTAISQTINAVVKWKQGEAHKYYEYDADIVHKATQRAAIDMGMTIQDSKSRKNSKIAGNYQMIAGSNDRFKIKIEQVDGNIYKLSVRINFMGDKEYTELFFSKVDEQICVVDF